jgi:hypothetical protein
MNWRPIDEYDAMPSKERPRRAVFFFRSEPGRPHRPESGLPPYVGTERSFGYRVCTHWLALPADPQEG